MKITAAVAREPAGALSIETLELDAPRHDEVLVRIVATGLCHTDIAVRDQNIPTPLPLVLGHEGSGVIEAVGSHVTDLAPGDHVILGFAACRQCSPCLGGEPNYCAHFMSLNFGGARLDGSKALHDENGDVGSHFFGQSSFASHAVVQARNVIKVGKDAPLELLGPLGCGLMTGAGTVLNTLALQAGHSILVSAAGPVGMAGVMAAKSVGATTIIVSDPLESRRAMAIELGATHVIDPSKGAVDEQVRAIVPGGVDRVLDSSGIVTAIEAAVRALGSRGRLAMVGVPKSFDATVSVPILPMLSMGQSVHGVTEGDADPRDIIPQLIAMHAAGTFPFDRLIMTYPMADINRAIDDQHAGRCIKAVLLQ
jgi:aryl-alcohol dehydrogenase